MDLAEDLILRISELIKDNYDTKSIKSIISAEYSITESQAASLIKKTRKSMGIFNSNSGQVSRELDEFDEDEEYQASYKKDTSKYSYKSFGSKNYY